MNRSPKKACKLCNPSGLPAAPLRLNKKWGNDPAPAPAPKGGIGRGIPSSARPGRLAGGPFDAPAALRGDDPEDDGDECEFGTEPADEEELEPPEIELFTGVEDEEPPCDEDDDADEAAGEGFLKSSSSSMEIMI